MRGPPLLARWILRRRVSGAIGDAVEGDLHERFGKDVATVGPIRARLRYWRDVLSPTLAGIDGAARDLDPSPGTPPRSTVPGSVGATLLRDLRYALRSLRKSPAFTAIAVLSLAVAIGPNTALFTVVNAVLLRAPEVPEPDRLIDVYNLSTTGRWFYTDYSTYQRLRDETESVFEGVAAWAPHDAAVGSDGRPEPASYEMVTGNFFEVLGVRPHAGRFFLTDEDRTLATHPVVVVSYPFWQSRLAGDPGAVGSTLRINGRPYTVVGVAPDGFSGTSMPGVVQADFWVPYSMHPHLAPNQATNGNMGIVARIRDGTAVGTAVAAVEAVGSRIDEERRARGSNATFTFGAFPWTQTYLHPSNDGALLASTGLLMAIVALVLVIACVNLAGFLLARATDRRREVAVRLALGASRASVARQHLTESVLVALAGGVLGLGLGVWTARALASIELPIPLPLDLDLALDWKVLSFTAGVSVLAGLIFGLTPALHASRSPVSRVLRDEGNAVAGRAGGLRLRGALVVGQTALSVLLVGAGLFVRSLGEANAIDRGFDTGPAALVQIDGLASGYEAGSELVPLIERTVESVAARPEVTSAAVVTRLPLGLGTWVRDYRVPGVDPPPGRNSHRIEVTSVSEHYYEVMGIPIEEGRAFGPEDDAGAPPVVIVSRALADAFWPGESAVGRTLLPVGELDRPVTVVGVAGNVKIWSVDEPDRPYLYGPLAQDPSTTLNVVARGPGDPASVGRIVVEALSEADPDLFMPRVGTMEEHLASVLFLPRLGAWLVGLFALLALGLSAIGLYGVVSYGAARRTKEMGIRISLGAAGGDVVRLVVRRGLGLAAMGVGLGMVGALATAWTLSDFLIAVRPWDPATLVSVPVILLAVAGAAAMLPARKAGRVDPAEALRAE